MNIINYFKQILIDKDNGKYSFPKFLALGGHTFICLYFLAGISIMITKKEIDHALLIEMIGYVLTLTGFKNQFGFRKTGSDNSQNNQNLPTNTGKQEEIL